MPKPPSRNLSHAFPYSHPIMASAPPVQLERWSMLSDPDGFKAEISVIYYADKGCFEIAYFEGRACRIQETSIFTLEEVYKKLEEVRRKVDPDAFDKGQARFVQHRGRTREDVARLEQQSPRQCKCPPNCNCGHHTKIDHDSFHCGG